MPAERPPQRGAARRRPETRVVTGVQPTDDTPAQVRRRFRALLDAGWELRPAGRARHDPELLLRPRYLPRHEVALFDATFFLTDFLFEDSVSFFVAYVALQEPGGRRRRRVHPRIFYKDSSLLWRVASHVVRDHGLWWMGKGDVRWMPFEDGQYLCSDETTTDLPYELHAALDTVSRRKPRRRDDDAIGLVAREGPAGRVAPYADFVTPRRRAAARHRIHGGRRVAWFARRNDPSSLRFARGYEPDLRHGLLEESAARSRYFGGALRKLRVLSANRDVQYLFIASPRHVWLNPPQTLTTELSSYGVRTLDVLADDDLFVPGYEYHALDPEDPEHSESQIPRGFAGAPHPEDATRADASAWIEALPVIQEFRARVLRERPSR